MHTGIAAMAIFTGCALRSNTLHHASGRNKCMLVTLFSPHMLVSDTHSLLFCFRKKLCAGLKYRNTLGISVSYNILFGEFVTSRPEWLCMDQNMNEGYFSNIYVEVVTSISIRFALILGSNPD
ncbi:hypothetical protein ACQJBY_015560 [Aegilops geniculata]